MSIKTIKSVVKQLNTHKGKYRQICDATGLDYSWLTKFAQGKISNPGYHKIQTLSAHLESLNT